jgi:hypothetical protein
MAFARWVQRRRGRQTKGEGEEEEASTVVVGSQEDAATTPKVKQRAVIFAAKLDSAWKLLRENPLPPQGNISWEIRNLGHVFNTFDPLEPSHEPTIQAYHLL